MKTIEVQLFSFNELSEEAQQVAIQKQQENQEYFWADENSKTLEEFENLFGLGKTSYEYGYRSYATANTGNIDDDILELKGKRLLSYIWNNYGVNIFTRKYLGGGLVNERIQPYHRMRKQREITTNCSNKGKISTSYYSNIRRESYNCPFTGYYIDNEILAPVFKLWETFNPNITFEEVIEECIESWLKACDRDYEYIMSEEHAKEQLEEDTDEKFTEEGQLY